MKLSMIAENVDLSNKLTALLDDSPAVRKLVRWALSGHPSTNPGERHTGQILRRELEGGARLVGNPWKEDVEPGDFDGLEVADYGNQWMVSLPENRDVLRLVVAGPFAGTQKTHLVRGLAFGYNPPAVLMYYEKNAPRDAWKALLRKLGIKTSEEYETGGYSSVADPTSGSVIVEPGDREQVERNLDKLGKLKFVIRWCPECQSDILMYGKYHSDKWPTEVEQPPTSCPHEPVHTPEVQPATKRHWFDYWFEPTSLT